MNNTPNRSLLLLLFFRYCIHVLRCIRRGELGSGSVLGPVPSSEVQELVRLGYSLPRRFVKRTIYVV